MFGAFLATVALAIASQITCPDGSCQGWRPAPGVSSQPAPAWAVRVAVSAGVGRSVGSGAIIAGRTVDGSAEIVVLTAAHVAGRRGLPAAASLRVDGTVVEARGSVYSLAPGSADAALILLRAPVERTAVATLATSDPPIGSILTCGGFGPDGRWQAVRGRLRSYSTSGDYIIECSVRSGDSGGPVMTDSGELCGVIWGSDHRGTTVAVSLTRLGDWLTGRYVFPWNAWSGAAMESQRQETERARIAAQQPAQQPQSPAAQFPDARLLSEAIDRLTQAVTGLASAVGSTANGGTPAPPQGAAPGGIAPSPPDTRPEPDSWSWLGAATAVAIGVVVLIMLWWDIRQRQRTGDPLGIEKLLQAIAARTPTPVDDWLVALLSRALDRTIGRPEATETQQGRKRGSTG